VYLDVVADIRVGVSVVVVGGAGVLVVVVEEIVIATRVKAVGKEKVVVTEVVEVAVEVMLHAMQEEVSVLIKVLLEDIILTKIGVVTIGVMVMAILGKNITITSTIMLMNRTSLYKDLILFSIQDLSCTIDQILLYIVQIL